MKINFLILLSILSIVILSCDDGVKFDNPNDEKNKAEIQQGELGGECYPNKTCNEGLTCDKENNTCVEEPKDTNDDEKPNSDDEDSWDSVKDDDDSIDDSDSGIIPDDGDDSDSNDTTPDEDNDNADNISDNDSLDHNNEVDLETNDQDADDEQEFPVDEDVDSGCVDTCVPIEPECLPAIDSEYTSGLCNGLDDDCDGKVDEDCPCKAGEVQACFSGPRNFKNIGTCKEGVQTCIVTLESEFGTWGDCVGEIKPSADVCDNADNNCNGCKDDKLCCAPPIDCAFDVNAEPARPFVYKIIDGDQIYDTGSRFHNCRYGKRSDLCGAVQPVEGTRSARGQNGDFRCSPGLEKSDRQVL